MNSEQIYDPSEKSEDAHPTSTDPQMDTPVMGGQSGTYTLFNQQREEHHDPSQIVESHRNTQATDQRQNIVIDAGAMRESIISQEGTNKMQSFLKNFAGSGNTNTAQEEASKRDYTSISEEEKTSFDDFKRRFQGRPANRESKHYTIAPEACIRKFLVTKVRSWRTGYSRILSLHKTYFTTLDPDTREITNLWHYSQVRQYSAILQEPDCFLVDVQ
jgi:type IV secretory pathway VirB10-like protein